MSYCSRPSKTTSTAYGAPATKTVGAPPPRDESCGPAVSTVVTGGGTSTTTTTYVPGPPGPIGPTGADGLGFIWRGEFALNYAYKKQVPITNPLADVISYEGQTWICIQDNESTTEGAPEYQPDISPSFWALVAAKGTGALAGEDKDFFDSLKDDIFDWWNNATLTDILLAGLAAAGVIYAGSVILDMITDNGEGDGDADARYTGSDGLVTSAYSAPDIKVVLAELCEYAGIPYDVSALPSEECMFVIGNNTSIRSIVDQLSLAYQFEMVDTNGVFRFVPRAATAVKTLTNDDIGYDKSSTPAARYTAKRFQGIDLPRSITLNYYAEDTDYNTMTQTSQLFTFEEGQDVNLTVPVTLSHAKAKQVTELALVQSHVERMQFKFTVNYNNIDLEPGDVVETPMGKLRITKMNELDEGLIEIEATDAGVAESIATSELVVAIPPASTNIPVSIGYSQAFFIDPPNVDSTDTGVRIYAAVHGYDRAGWPGAQLWVSTDNGNSYNVVSSTSAESTVGLVASVVPARSHYVWDETTTISVQLKTNSLLSRSELAVLNGENWCMIGQEIIGFKNATLTGPMTYTLSGLLRGRQGTEQFISEHVANELFVLLDANVLKVEWPDTERGTIKKYKVVTIGSSLDKVDAQDVQMNSNNKRLWTVHSPAIELLAGDFRLTWKERIRFNNQLTDGAEITHDVDWAGFGVAIYNGANIIKTYTTTSELFVYTGAMQIADFGAAQTTLTAKVTQLSQLGAPGYPVTLNI